LIDDEHLKAAQTVFKVAHRRRSIAVEFLLILMFVFRQQQHQAITSLPALSEVEVEVEV
jgi:hypothetical protein